MFKILVWTTVILALIAIAAILIRAFAQREVKWSLTIEGPHGLEQGMFVTLGGLPQSMGSAIGVLIASKRPEFFRAYVGSDQVVDMAENEKLSFEMLVERARALNDASLIASVEKVGSPPYSDVERWFAKQRMISKSDPIAPAFERQLFRMVMTAPGYGMKEMMAFGAGLKFSAATLLHEMMTLDLGSLGTRLDVPVVLVEGEFDRINPTKLALEWFRTLEAPGKQVTIIKGAGHNSAL